MIDKEEIVSPEQQYLSYALVVIVNTTLSTCEVAILSWKLTRKLIRLEIFILFCPVF